MRQLKWSLTAAYLVCVALAWRTLPARFPFHFNRHGVVDRWVDKSPETWFMLPVLLVGLLLLMELSIALTLRKPQLWNVPEKQRFLAMTEEQRAPIYLEFRNLMDAISIGVILLFSAIHYTMYSVATKHYSRMPMAIIGLALIYMLGIVIYTFIFNMKIKAIILSADDHSSVGTAG